MLLGVKSARPLAFGLLVMDVRGVLGTRVFGEGMAHLKLIKNVTESEFVGVDMLVREIFHVINVFSGSVFDGFISSHTVRKEILMTTSKEERAKR